MQEMGEKTQASLESGRSNSVLRHEQSDQHEEAEKAKQQCHQYMGFN